MKRINGTNIDINIDINIKHGTKNSSVLVYQITRLVWFEKKTLF